jgi:uncharacterized phage protein gp47/JayE
MPLTLRPKNDILSTMISSVLAGDIVSDIAAISTVRQFLEGAASTQADLDYDLYALLQSFYITSAEGVDLDTRGLDYGLARDSGQAASDPVVFTRLTQTIDDIPLPAQQVVQATLSDGTTVLYRSLGDAVLAASGRSVSGPAPGTALTAGVNDQVSLNVDGDGVRTLTLGAQSTATAIAAAIQAAVRALAALNPSHQPAYTTFRADYSVTMPGVYTLRSGTAGPSSSVVVSATTGSTTLKLGLGAGGLESVGMDSLSVPVICDSIGVIGNVSAGQINELTTQATGIDTVSNPLAFSNGREPASDDAYRQDVRAYILGLGRGTQDSILRAVYATLGSDGQRHVFAAQALYGVGTVQVFVCDGRSVTVGAQSDTVQDVQNELDGLGSEPGGWIAGGATVGVASCSILQVPIAVTVTVGPTPNLVQAQQAIRNALYTLVFQWPIGEALSYSVVARRIDETIVEVLNVVFTLPAAFSTTPTSVVEGGIGSKIMPAEIVVTVVRA